MHVNKEYVFSFSKQRIAKQLATILVVSISKQGVAIRTTDRFQGIKLACTLQHRILSIYVCQQVYNKETYMKNREGKEAPVSLPVAVILWRACMHTHAQAGTCNMKKTCVVNLMIYPIRSYHDI